MTMKSVELGHDICSSIDSSDNRDLKERLEDKVREMNHRR